MHTVTIVKRDPEFPGDRVEEVVENVHAASVVDGGVLMVQAVGATLLVASGEWLRAVVS